MLLICYSQLFELVSLPSQPGAMGFFLVEQAITVVGAQLYQLALVDAFTVALTPLDRSIRQVHYFVVTYCCMLRCELSYMFVEIWDVACVIKARM
mgnify:CR=1 FL=1